MSSDGKVKVLDFGLAKAWVGDTASGSSADLGSHQRSRTRGRRPASSWAPPPTCRPSRRGASLRTSGRTSGRSACCSTSCFQPLDGRSPVWSDDGRWIYYSVLTATNPQVARHAANGTGGAEFVYTSPDETPVIPLDLTPDGKWMLVRAGVTPLTIYGDLEWLSLDGSERRVPFLAAPAGETSGRRSPVRPRDVSAWGKP